MTFKATITEFCLLYDQSKKNTHLNEMVKPHVVSEPLGYFQVVSSIIHSSLVTSTVCLQESLKYLQSKTVS